MKPQRLILFTLLVASSSMAIAEDRTIELLSTGTVTVKPNLAVVSIGVETNAVSAKRAVKSNAEKTTKVIHSLQKLVKGKNAISTKSFNVAPVYQYDKESRSSKLTGYRVSNYVQVRETNLENLGQLFDAAIEVGGTNINNLQFQHSNDEKLANKALAKAVKAGTAKAKVIAEASGNQLGRLLKVSSTDHSGPAPMYESMRLAKASASTPIQAGDIDIEQQVRMVFALEDSK